MSEESTGLKTREEVPTELTWNLEAIFSTDEEWEEEFEALKEEYKKVEKFKGTLADSPENLLKLFQFEDEFDGRLESYMFMHICVPIRIRQIVNTKTKMQELQVLRQKR